MESSPGALIGSTVSAKKGTSHTYSTSIPKYDTLQFLKHWSLHGKTIINSCFPTKTVQSSYLYCIFMEAYCQWCDYPTVRTNDLTKSGQKTKQSDDKWLVNISYKSAEKLVESNDFLITPISCISKPEHLKRKMYSIRFPLLSGWFPGLNIFSWVQAHFVYY